MFEISLGNGGKMSYKLKHGLAQRDNITWTPEIPKSIFDLCKWNSDWGDLTDTPIPLDSENIAPNWFLELKLPKQNFFNFVFMINNDEVIEEGIYEIPDDADIDELIWISGEAYQAETKHECSKELVTYYCQSSTNQHIYNYIETSISKENLQNRVDKLPLQNNSDMKINWNPLDIHEITRFASWEDEPSRTVDDMYWLKTCCNLCFPTQQNSIDVYYYQEDEIDVEEALNYLLEHEWDEIGIQFYAEAFKEFWDQNGTSDLQDKITEILKIYPNHPISFQLQDL